MDGETGIRPVKGCMMCVVFADTPLMHYTNVLPSVCMYVPSIPTKPSGPLVNVIEFIDQQTLHPALVVSLLIELNCHFDISKENTMSLLGEVITLEGHYI